MAAEERAKAFAWLATHLGFDVGLEESLCARPWAPGGPGTHQSVVARVEGRRILADAGFPLPFLIPLQLPSKEIPSSFGALSAASFGAEGGRDGFRVTCDARGEAVDVLRAGSGAGARAGAAGAPAPFATRVLDDRVLHWEAGGMTILDAWSVLRYPLAGTERAAFESLFALNLEGVELPALPAADFAPVLTVFHTVPLSPEDVSRGLALAERPASDLVAPAEAFIEAVPGGSRVARSARFLAPVPAAGPGESVRKTLVFHLAMDLLGLGSA